MWRRQGLSAAMALLLAGITMLVLPSHGNTSGWKDSYSPTLPAPGGSYAVGVRRTRLLEAGRLDPWRPDTEREVMVDIHYPADSGSRPLKQYYVSAAMTELGSLTWAPDEERRLGLVSDEVNWLFRTHSHEWAPPAAGRFPVLMLSTPPGLLRTSFTGMAEELASHGYVVVSVDHPYDAPVVEFFPTRRVVRATDAQVPISRAAADAARVADLTSVVARLGDLDRDLTPVLDQQRVGLVGWVGSHSADLSRLAHLPNVAAVASVAAGPVTVTGAGRTPLLVVKGAATRVEGHSPGWSAKVTVSGATERSLTDDGATLPGIAQAYPRTAPAVRRAVADTAASITQQTVRHYVTAFFNLHLRGISTAFAARPGPGVSIETSTPESR